jgi:hypothetical protein
MPTTLVNRKMSPALRARVEAAVSGRAGSRRAPERFRATMRLLFVLTVLATVVVTFSRNRVAARELERRRAAVLAELAVENASLDARQRGAVERDEVVLHDLAGMYPGDVRALDLRAPGALAKPIVYVHGPVDAFGVGASIDRAAAASVDDTFVRCLLDPPRSRSERDVLAKVRAVYGASSAMRDVHRLADAYVALGILQPAFTDRVRDADARELLRLEHRIERAHLGEAKKALAAPLLLAVLDEPGDSRVAADLDGERPHDVRVELYDTVQGKTLLRARRTVDPNKWSAASRIDFSTGLDQCALAWDLREGATARDPSTP